MMRFIINIISIIEPRGVVKIQDLTSLLKFKACFPFGNKCFGFVIKLIFFFIQLKNLFSGYPNLITFMQAFPDIFVYTPSKTNAFRGDVKLNNQCIRKLIKIKKKNLRF